MIIWRLVTLRFLSLFFVCAATLYFVVGAGQVAQLARIVGGLQYIHSWSILLFHAVIILSEVVLPLAVLFATALLFMKLRHDGSAAGLASVGIRPSALLVPVGLWASLIALFVSVLAHQVIPNSIHSIGLLATQAAGHRILGDTLSNGAIQVRREGTDTQKSTYWATLARPDRAALLIRGEAPKIRSLPEPRVSLTNLEVWSPEYHLRVGEVTLRLDEEDVSRRLRMFGPPNALPSEELNPMDNHHMFTFNRRTAVPLMAIPWAVLGGSLGLMLSAVPAVSLAAISVALSYWVLRLGELAARAGEFSPTLAAWVPLLLTVILMLVALRRLDDRGAS